MKRLNTASLLLRILLPPQHVIYTYLLSTPLSATSAMMTCRIILNLGDTERGERYRKCELLRVLDPQYLLLTMEVLGTQAEQSCETKARSSHKHSSAPA
jgi:hypothetical protein